jgi:[NiFe] hydrogenase assembly HybE family chaperone
MMPVSVPPDDTPLAARVEAVFRVIAATRMAGVPVLNPALDVAMRGLCRHGAHDLGVLVTPWFMNLMAFGIDAEFPVRVGEKMDLALPSGAYEAIRGHEAELGGYWMVSLFSPMDDFESMEAAIATADAAMAEIMTPPEAEPETPPPAPAISRRGLFRWARDDAEPSA